MSALRTLGLKAGLNGLYACGAHRLFGPLTRGAGAILMFHHVRTPRPSAFRPNAHLDITPQFLAAVIRRLRAVDIDIVDLDEAVERLARPSYARRFVVLTFDDGYRNNFTEAYPVLKAADAPFTIYVATGLVDRTAVPWWDVVGALVERQDAIDLEIGGRRFARPARTIAQKRRAMGDLIPALLSVDEDEQRRIVCQAASRHAVDVDGMLREAMMDWEEIGQLTREPLATIGAHTVGHYALARLDGARAQIEMGASRERIAAMTGMRPRHFAYPYGSMPTAGDREFAYAAELGFATAVTTRRGVLRVEDGARLTALPRISVNGSYQSLHYLDLFLSGVPYALESRLSRFRGSAPASASRR